MPVTLPTQLIAPTLVQTVTPNLAERVAAQSAAGAVVTPEAEATAATLQPAEPVPEAVPTKEKPRPRGRPRKRAAESVEEHAARVFAWKDPDTSESVPDVQPATGAPSDLTIIGSKPAPFHENLLYISGGAPIEATLAADEPRTEIKADYINLGDVDLSTLLHEIRDRGFTVTLELI